MTPDPTEPDSPQADAVEATGDATGDDPAEGTEEAFQNRAARRAHSKGRRPPQPDDKGHLGAGRGSVQGPRQWGNRRSG